MSKSKLESAHKDLAKATGDLSLMMESRKITKRKLLVIIDQINNAKQLLEKLTQ